MMDLNKELELKRVGVASCAKIVAAIYGTFGLLAGCIIAAVSVAGTASGASSPPGSYTLIGGLGAMIAAPVVYGLIGALVGAVFGTLFNVAARHLGGIKFEVGETNI